jgi:hypothetical protein
MLPRHREPCHEDTDMANRLQVVQPSVQPSEPASAMMRGTGRLETRPEPLGTYGLALFVPGGGLEPPRAFTQRILSPPRLPFRHPGIGDEDRFAGCFVSPDVADNVGLPRSSP